MPVEIKELIIRAIATEAREKGDDDEAEKMATGVDPQQALVEACVRQVLNILKRSKER